MDEQQRFLKSQDFGLVFSAFVSLADLVGHLVHPAIQAAPKSNALDQQVYGMHMRALAWAFSLRRLDHVFDFQAHSAGCRSLFEIAIDLALLTRGVEPAEKMRDWELCAKHEAAKRALKIGGGLPQIEQRARTFVASYATAVAAACTRWRWNVKRPPMRWTGHPLAKDAERADGAVPLGLAAFARDHYDLVVAQVSLPAAARAVLVPTVAHALSFPRHAAFNSRAASCRAQDIRGPAVSA